MKLIDSIDPWEPSLAPMRTVTEYAHRARIKHEKEQLRILALITAWDRMTAEQKWAEWDKEIDAEGDHRFGSEFTEVPGFNPKYCAGCVSRVFLNFRDDPAGACPFDATHSIAAIVPLSIAV